MASLPSAVPLSEIPLAPNPSGAPPNFINPPSLRGAVQGVGITFAIVSLILVLNRLTVIRRSSRPFGLDDASVVLAWVIAATYTGVACSRVYRHAWDSPVSFFDATYIKTIFFSYLIYGPMLFFAKASILITYYRIFQPEIWLRICTYIFLFIMLMSYWFTVPLSFYYCMPRPNTGDPWDIWILLNCANMNSPGLVQAGFNIAADVAIFILPLPVVFKLRMPLAKKCYTIAVFATGNFALAASILTLYYRIQVVRGNDGVWAGAQTYICTFVFLVSPFKGKLQSLTGRQTN
ncbi:hypothetical protein HIM_04237 [Hirsutella minnesotensis 3608]|uniref:Rhodopsin domain-containing protein n=1 Tax=Hirsutella minnesotensis 3608 TaxID=1043627 RepID=A0A0F7ZVF2_9HYPO|nr:hypothetical protein HIM_04237 [Hirsutella minnesotensis 3608]